MQRLYKFIFLFFLVAFVIMSITGFGIAWLLLHHLFIDSGKGLVEYPVPANLLVKPALFQGLIYASALVVIIALLMKRSIQYRHPFTIRTMIHTTTWFLVCTIGFAFMTYIVQFPLKLNFKPDNMMSAVEFPAFVAKVSRLFWLPLNGIFLVIIWGLLYFILANRIQPQEDYGR